MVCWGRLRASGELNPSDAFFIVEDLVHRGYQKHLLDKNIVHNFLFSENLGGGSGLSKRSTLSGLLFCCNCSELFSKV